ncbi:uncharacterized protein LOC124880286 isoform X2 [Girardinichthys multiradiatus]|uniref:uncharacterized protein LOC124880286 isoform X2 n=1 Tax=Girardinichthys multiradiatus TaxID=208333 RepID=UPI001FAE1A0E|nr:uncharacterized protein LOC124880286 isoform X2 [Girardinichthys multiradiatus]
MRRSQTERHCFNTERPVGGSELSANNYELQRRMRNMSNGNVSKDRIGQAAAILNSILSSPDATSSVTCALNERASLTARSDSVETQLASLFRAGAASRSSAVSTVNQGPSSVAPVAPRFQAQQCFGSWTTNRRRRCIVCFVDHRISLQEFFLASRNPSGLKTGNRTSLFNISEPVNSVLMQLSVIFVLLLQLSFLTSFTLGVSEGDVQQCFMDALYCIELIQRERTGDNTQTLSANLSVSLFNELRYHSYRTLIEDLYTCFQSILEEYDAMLRSHEMNPRCLLPPTKWTGFPGRPQYDITALQISHCISIGMNLHLPLTKT